MSDSSDSDNDLFGCRNRSMVSSLTTISARGPNHNFSTTLQIPRPFTRPRYAQSTFDQRSISGGGLSARSVRSASTRNHRNYSYYNRQAMLGPGSLYNKRSPSPMSVRSKESCARPVILDVAHVLKYDADYNDEEELEILEEACFTFLNNKRKYKKYVSSNRSLRSMPTGSNIPSFNQTGNKPPPPTMTQKERFKNGYLLPSQRFNLSAIPTSNLENGENVHNGETRFQNGHLAMNRNSEKNIETDSDEDIFSNTENSRKSIKRSIDSEDLFLPNKKRHKPLSPCKNSIEGQKIKASDVKLNDFIFAKPTCPARKSVKEKLISKSAAPLDVISHISMMPVENKDVIQDKPIEDEQLNEDEPNSTSNMSNLSMRPSFIKRKLFTQTLDVTEKGNLSVENTATPEKNTIQKEKHKTRKLQQTSTQSCLSRDIQHDESNLLDLIQKIVPIDQTIVANETNRTVSQSKNITEDNESDTYTDEEILNQTIKELEKEDVAKRSTIKAKDDKVITPKKTVKAKSPRRKELVEKLSAKHQRIKQFWDTDFETTDDEIIQSPPKADKTTSKEICIPDRQECSNLFNYKKSTGASIFQTCDKNFTFDTTQKINISTFKVMCHRAPKRNKLNTDEAITSALHKSENKINKDLGCKSAKNYTVETKTIANVEKKKECKNTVTEKETKKLPEGEKPAAKKDHQMRSSKKSDNKKYAKSKEHTDPTETNVKKNQKAQNSQKTKQHLVENKTAAKNRTNPKEIIVNSKVSHNKSSNNKETKTQTKNCPSSKENNEPSKKQPNSYENNTSTIKHSNPKELLNVSKATLKQTPANNIPIKKKTQNNSSSLLEESNNKTNRPIRSCRLNSLNQSADKSTLEQKNTINSSLRSRRNINSACNKNNAKVEHKASLSDVSFSVGTKKNNLSTKGSKITSSCFNLNESDISFSLIPSPRVTRSRSASRNNTMNTPLQKNPSRNKGHISDVATTATVDRFPKRIRTPNIRYKFT